MDFWTYSIPQMCMLHKQQERCFRIIVEAFEIYNVFIKVYWYPGLIFIFLFRREASSQILSELTHSAKKIYITLMILAICYTLFLYLLYVEPTAVILAMQQHIKHCDMEMAKVKVAHGWWPSTSQQMT